MSAVASGAPSTKSVQTQQKLIEAGITLFSKNGYPATSTRMVQVAAGVQRNLITYHFGSKEEFWKACMAELFARIQRVLEPAISQARDIEPTERIRFLIRQHVRASAAHPESIRIMFDEGRCADWRLEYLVDTYVRDFYRSVLELYESGTKHGVVAEISVVQFYYVLVGGTAVFAMAPECELLTGEDAFSAEMIDAQANAIADLLVRDPAG